MRYVYILLLANGNLYTGCTEDPKRRIHEHQDGRVASTKHLRPVRLVHYEAYLYPEDANRRERYLKTTEGRRFLKQQIKVFFERDLNCGEVAEWPKAAHC